MLFIIFLFKTKIQEFESISISASALPEKIVLFKQILFSNLATEFTLFIKGKFNSVDNIEDTYENEFVFGKMIQLILNFLLFQQHQIFQVVVV